MEDDWIKGQGAQHNTANRFLSTESVKEHPEGIDDWEVDKARVQYLTEHPKKFINKVDSPDVGAAYSMNPYQGCEHGCIYCYARNSHEYWGYSAGVDFERKIIVKPDAPMVLEKHLRDPNWTVWPIMLSGNTDCYQPAERHFKLTRQILGLLLNYRHPVSLITKNALIIRDLDLLAELASLELVNVSVSLTSLNEELRSKLEPRTATARRRLQAMEALSKAGIPVNAMLAPIIPGLNDHEIPDLLKASANAGAITAGYTVVRLNGNIQFLFTEWIHKTFPDRADKVLAQIAECHGGRLNDSQWGRRMRGEGQWAEMIKKVFILNRQKYMGDKVIRPLNRDHFLRAGGKQGQLF